MDDIATLIRGIGRIALAMRERADTVKWANASHLHAIADSIDHEINSVEPRRRQWRDAPAEQQGKAEVIVGTYRGMPVRVRANAPATFTSVIYEGNGEISEGRRTTVNVAGDRVHEELSKAEVNALLFPDRVEPIRAVFRQCGMYDAAANDRLCLDLYLAVTKRAVVVPIVNQEVLDEASEVALRTGFAMTDGAHVLSKEDVAAPSFDHNPDAPQETGRG